MAGRDISSLPLSPRTVELLQRSGYRLYGDLMILLNNLPSILEFSADLRVKVTDAQAVLHELKGLPIETTEIIDNSDPLSRIAASQKQEEIKRLTPISVSEMIARCPSSKIITFSRSIDKLFGGGIPVGQLTEICGVPGVGKTQLSIQLALDVQIPACFPQGINGKCIYIDTEGSFHIERAHTMAEAVSQHLKKTMYGKRKPDGTYELEPNIKAARESAVLQYTTEQFLDGIYLIRAHDSTELLAVVNRLPSLMDQILNVKLILIDSIAFPFRQRLHDVATRTRLIAGIALTLQKIAHERQVAVVVTNHVTSKFNKNKGQKHNDEDRAPDEFENVIIADSSIRDIFNTSTELLPALGDTWSHAVTNRMMMHFHKGDRCASLMKSSSLKCSSCVFTITEDGIRDIHKKNEQSKKICT